ncbi:MAG: lycopene cyclase family protein [Bacteroidota bacterium]
MSTYDYIIIGAGASGLLLADALGSDSFFKGKSILVLEKSSKTKNDRTWCFWERGAGEFDDILHREWPKIHFGGKHLNINPEIAPYNYKMLRGIDFYECYLKKLDIHSNITLGQDEIKGLEEEDNFVSVLGEKETYQGLQVFDSRFDYKRVQKESKYPVLQQHFLGWFIKTDRSVFDQETASFMDFSIPQKGNTRFMYVLPLSPSEALVEYTLFSEDVLQKEEYEQAIRDYILTKIGIEQYEITEMEQGNIPMTCYDFTQGNTNRILKIGTAGGWAKASTGYTFYSSVKKVKMLVSHLKNKRGLAAFGKKDRFWFYDLLLLDILHKNNHLGRSIFESLFKKRKPQLIFKFLDEDTHFLEEVYIMASPKPWPFIKALLNRLFS